MDVQLEDWRSRGRSYDYLGFEVFYRQEGTGPGLLLIHRRPDIYEQPTRWRADRFFSTRPPPGAWIPFGGGVRRCVGAAFAQFEASTILDEVTRTLELRPAGRPTRRVGRRGIVLVPPRGGTVIPSSRHASAPLVAAPR